jgi:hypothetical protein
MPQIILALWSAYFLFRLFTFGGHERRLGLSPESLAAWRAARQKEYLWGLAAAWGVVVAWIALPIEFASFASMQEGEGVAYGAAFLTLGIFFPTVAIAFFGCMALSLRAGRKARLLESQWAAAGSVSAEATPSPVASRAVASRAVATDGMVLGLLLALSAALVGSVGNVWAWQDEFFYSSSTLLAGAAGWGIPLALAAILLWNGRLPALLGAGIVFGMGLAQFCGSLPIVLEVGSIELPTVYLVPLSAGALAIAGGLVSAATRADTRTARLPGPAGSPGLSRRAGAAIGIALTAALISVAGNAWAIVEFHTPLTTPTLAFVAAWAVPVVIVALLSPAKRRYVPLAAGTLVGLGLGQFFNYLPVVIAQEGLVGTPAYVWLELAAGLIAVAAGLIAVAAGVTAVASGAIAAAPSAPSGPSASSSPEASQDPLP